MRRSAGVSRHFVLQSLRAQHAGRARDRTAVPKFSFTVSHLLLFHLLSGQDPAHGALAPFKVQGPSGADGQTLGVLKQCAVSDDYCMGNSIP